MEFFEKTEKAFAALKLFEHVSYEDELQSFFSKLQIETQMALRIEVRVKLFESIEKILEVMKPLEESAGIKDEPLANVAKKGERYKDRRDTARRPWKRDEAREETRTENPYLSVRLAAAVPIMKRKF